MSAINSFKSREPRAGFKFRILSTCLAVALIVVCPGWGFAGGPGNPKKPEASSQFSSDKIIVKFKQEYSRGAHDLKHKVKSQAAANLEKSLTSLGVRFHRHFETTGISVLNVTDRSLPLRKGLLKQIQKSGLVEYAEPDWKVQIDTHAALIPNDPKFTELWGMHNTGQTGGVPDADIDAPEAWSHETGDPNLIAVVLDTGVDYNHVDLADNIWTNTNEIVNGIDDDGNGYIDDLHGIDTFNGDANPQDDHGHGTHVAGTLGAKGNNSIGVAGVSQNVKIMACKFLDAGGSGSLSGAVECLDYVQSMKLNHGWTGIRLTNNSWGCVGCFSQALMDSIQAQGNSGILFVAASGNLGIDTDITPHYPSGYELNNIISVAASDANDQIASFSDFGALSVDLAAPGVNITSTLPGNAYNNADWSGTSMATPHVSGAAMLAWSRFPSATAKGIRSLLMNTVDPVPSMAGRSVTGGRLNVASAVTCVPGTPEMRLLGPGPGFEAVQGSKVIVSATVHDCAELIASAQVDVNPSNGDGAFPLRDDGVGPDQEAGDGIYTAEWYPGTVGDVQLNYQAVVGGTTLNGIATGAVVKNYIVDDKAPYSWVDARNTGAFVGLNDWLDHDDAWVSFPIGFEFSLYETLYNTLYISSNGFITFNTAGASFYNNTHLPDPSVPNEIIAPWWDDICPVTGEGVWSKMEGTSPNRSLTIEWVNFGPWPCLGNGTFEVTLFEGSNDIRFQYQNIDMGGIFGSGADGGALATVGLEDLTGTKGVEYSFNTPSLSNGKAILFHLPEFAAHTLTLTSGPSGGPNPVAPGGQVNMAVNAVDSAIEHAISYAWSAGCPTLGTSGTFSDPAAQNPAWTAPSNNSGDVAACTITVTADDASGLTASRSYVQQVDTGASAHTLTIASVGGTPNPVDSGGTVALSVSAVDSEGHALNYAWSADCSSWAGTNGSFNSNTLQSPSWTAPANTGLLTQSCVITVAVDDGNGALVRTRSFNQDVDPDLSALEELVVVAPEDPTFCGPKGGPYAPQNLTYTVANLGPQNIDFSVFADANWLQANPASGTLAPLDVQDITVTLTNRANRLRENTYTSPLDFINNSTGRGNASSTVTLIIGTCGGEPPPDPQPSGTFVVTPDADFSVSGKSGTFNGQAQVYTLTNPDTKTAMSYAVSVTGGSSWISILSPSGDIPAGGQASVTVQLTQEADALVKGRYEDTVVFTDTTSGQVVTSHLVKLNVRGGN